MVLVPEILSLFFHTLSFILGLYLVKKHEDVFTRRLIPKKRKLCVDYVEFIYLVVVLSVMTNLWFLYNQTEWMVKNYDKHLKDMVYLQWMWYHTGTGIVVSMLHLVIHWLLNELKIKLNKNTPPEVKTNWKL